MTQAENTLGVILFPAAAEEEEEEVDEGEGKDADGASDEGKLFNEGGSSRTALNGATILIPG